MANSVYDLDDVLVAPDADGHTFGAELARIGHDACSISQVAPTAMTLTPCHGGITHSVHEEIDLAKTLPGVNLLLNAVVRRANR